MAGCCSGKTRASTNEEQPSGSMLPVTGSKQSLGQRPSISCWQILGEQRGVFTSTSCFWRAFGSQCYLKIIPEQGQPQLSKTLAPVLEWSPCYRFYATSLMKKRNRFHVCQKPSSLLK